MLIMIIYNATYIDNATATPINTTDNSTLPWYINGEGAMAFSIAVILVFGMSIIFFIMLSVNKTRTDREEEKQIWSYLKTYRQVRSDALKDDEQRIRAKLLYMSIIGEHNNETQLQPQSVASTTSIPKSNGKISKLKERRNMTISRCLRVDSEGSEAWTRQLSAEDVMESLDEDLVTVRTPHSNRNSTSDTEPTNDAGVFLHPRDCNANHRFKIVGDVVAHGNEHDVVHSDPTSRRSGSVPNANATVTRLPQVSSLKVIHSLKDDAMNADKSLSQNELETIRSRRRKRSGYVPPKLELLDIPLPVHPKIDLKQDETDPFDGPSSPTATPTTPVSFVIGDEQISKPFHTGHYQKSAHATKGHRISGETPRPKLTRRAQSFRFHERKRSFRRKNSLELPGTLNKSNDRIAFQDNEFARSLNCRRHDRRNRISVVCLPHNGDSDSSNDMILPAITLPQAKSDATSSDDTDHSDLVQDVMEEVSRRSSVASTHYGYAADCGNNRASVEDPNASPLENAVHTTNLPKEYLQDNSEPQELVPLVSDQDVPVDSESGPNPSTLKRSSRTRRSGVINVQYRW